MARSTLTDADLDLADLLTDWQRSLEARNVAPKTVISYLATAEQFVAYLAATGMPSAPSLITREHVESFLANLIERGRAAATVAKSHRNLKLLFKWLVDIGECQRSPMERMKAPIVPEQPIDVLDADDLKRLVKACERSTFEDRRDLAIVRLLLDTGVRLGELAGLTLEDIDLDRDVIVVLGKGRRPRAVPFGARASDSLRRYLRLRVRHRVGKTSSAVWLGLSGPLTDSGIRQVVQRRAEQAGLGHVHPH